MKNHVAFFARTKGFIGLVLIMIVDTLPIPILGLFFMFILLTRPHWFKQLVDDIYDVKRGINTDKD